MKTLLLSTSSSRNAGGLYNSVRNLGQALTTIEDVDPTACAYQDEYSDVDRKAYTPLKLVEYTVVGPKGFGLTFDLNSIINDINPDIIHQQGIWLFSSYVSSSYCAKRDIPYLISPRGMLDPWILKTRPWRKKLGLNLYESKNIKNSSCLHALGGPEYSAIRKFGYRKPIVIIPNGVSIPKVDDEIPTNIPFWKVNDQRKVLLFLSRLHPKKGIENLLKAWRDTKAIKDEWKLVIAGESNGKDYSESLIRLSESLGLQKDVFFIGAQFHSDKDLTFRHADSFILPSFSEGMPMAVLEAWAYRLPVLITAECNIPEGFENSAAIEIEPTKESIKEGLLSLMRMSEQDRKVMGENGYRLVTDRYSWDSIALQMRDVYNWIVEGGIRPDTVCLK